MPLDDSVMGFNFYTCNMNTVISFSLVTYDAMTDHFACNIILFYINDALKHASFHAED